MNLDITVAELAAATPGSQVIGDPSTVVRTLTYDSRTVAPGACFAALRGADVDGHAFLWQAASAGAVAVLTEQPVDLPVAQVIVPDSRAALAHLAHAFYRQPSHDVGVIGITGTDGKTTTSFLVDAILRRAGLRTGLIGTVTIRVGDEEDIHSTRQTTPESADVQRILRAMADRDIPWATLEATSHGLAMHRLDDVRFRIGGVTNITSEHLDYHGTVENYRAAKGILFERVSAVGGTSVINLDDAGACAMRERVAGGDVITYSAHGQPADLRATEIHSGGTGSTFRLETTNWGSSPVQLPMIGGFNVANALCAAGITLAAGLPLDQVVAGLTSAPGVPGRMALVDQGQPFTVVVDYAHTPEAMTKVLSLLRGLFPAGTIYTVFGSAGERDIQKRPMQGAVAVTIGDVAIVTSEDPRNEDADAIIDAIARGALAAGAEEGTTLHRRTQRRDAIALALDLAAPGDVILLAGKGHEGSIIWGREKRPWNEEQVARDLLSERGFTG